MARAFAIKGNKAQYLWAKNCKKCGNMIFWYRNLGEALFLVICTRCCQVVGPIGNSVLVALNAWNEVQRKILLLNRIGGL